MALDIITAAVPNLIAFDVMAVQPMDNRIGMINYLDYTYSKTKGDTKAGTVFNSALLKNASDPNYSSNLVTNESVTIAQTSGEGQLSWCPVLDKQVKITYSDGTTTHTEELVTVDSTTGKFTVQHAPTEATTGVVTAYYYDNESVQADTNTNGYAGFGANVPEIELKMNSIPVEARARTLRSYWAFDAQYELQKEYGQDIETLLATQVTGELAH